MHSFMHYFWRGGISFINWWYLKPLAFLSVIHSAVMSSSFTPVHFCISEVGLQISGKWVVLCKVFYCYWIKDFPYWVCNPHRWTRRRKEVDGSQASIQQVRAGKQIKIHDCIQPSTQDQYCLYPWCKPFLVLQEHFQTSMKSTILFSLSK